LINKYKLKNFKFLERKKYVKASMGKFLKEKEKKVKQKDEVNRKFLKITLKINIIVVAHQLLIDRF